jgi:hypothetical protein
VCDNGGLRSARTFKLKPSFDLRSNDQLFEMLGILELDELNGKAKGKAAYNSANYFSHSEGRADLGVKLGGNPGA